MRILRVGIGLTLALALLATVWAALPAQATGGNRVTLAVTSLSRSGGAETMATADGDGHKFNNNGATWLRIVNAYTATVTATLITPGEVDGLPIDDLNITVSAGATRLAGPFQPGRFNQSDGTVYLDWNDEVTGTVAASVTVGAFRLQ